MRGPALRVGLIGAGRTGARHALTYRALDARCVVVGAYDPDAGAVSGLDLDLFPSPEALFAACDAVSICSPSDLHVAHLRAALAESCHVLLEKPVAPTLADAGPALDLAGARPDLVVHVGHVERFNPAFVEARRLLGGRAIRSLAAERCGPWRETGADVVSDLLVHDIDLALVLAPGAAVVLDCDGEVDRNGMLGAATAELLLAGGIPARLHACSRVEAADSRRRLVVETDDGILEVDLLRRRVSADWAPVVPAVVPGDAYRAQLEAFLASVSDCRVPPVPLDEAMRALEIVERIRATARDAVVARLTAAM